MGKIMNQRDGAISGAVGSLVFATWRGKPYVRTKPNRNYKKQSDKQKVQTSRFAVAVELVRRILPYLRVGYRTEATTGTAYNAAVSYTCKYGIVETADGMALDYPNVRVSLGSLTPAQDAQVMLEGDAAVFAWTDNTGSGDARADDLAMPMVLNTKLQQAIYLTDAAVRSDGQTALTLPASWLTAPCVAYLGFAATKSDEVSNSVYLGVL